MQLVLGGLLPLRPRPYRRTRSAFDGSACDAGVGAPGWPRGSAIGAAMTINSLWGSIAIGPIVPSGFASGTVGEKRLCSGSKIRAAQR